MQKKTCKCTYAFAATWCLIVLGALLRLAACSSPGSQPQQGSPSTGGYSLIQILDKELPLFLAPQRR